MYYERGDSDGLEKEMLGTTSKEELLELMAQEGVSDSLKNEAEEKYVHMAAEEFEAECRDNNARVGYRIENYQSTIVDAYQDRKGAYKVMIPTGMEVSKTHEVTVSVEYGEIFDGFRIGLQE